MTPSSFSNLNTTITTAPKKGDSKFCCNSVVPASNSREVDPKGHVLNCYQVLDLRYCQPYITALANQDSEHHEQVEETHVFLYIKKRNLKPFTAANEDPTKQHHQVTAPYSARPPGFDSSRCTPRTIGFIVFHLD